MAQLALGYLATCCGLHVRSPDASDVWRWGGSVGYDAALIRSQALSHFMNADEILKTVLEYDSSEINEIVRFVLDDESAISLPGIKAEHITAPSRGGETVALLRVEGLVEQNRQSTRWSVVLKVVESPGTLSKTDRLSGEREIAAYDSGFFDRPIVGIRPAKLYKSVHQHHLAWMWIEDLREKIGPPWQQEQYLQAAQGIGQFSGTFSADLPDNESWMVDDLVLKRWGADEIRRLPKISKLDGTELLLMDYLSGKAATDYMRLVEALDRLRPAVTAGARTLCHGDFHPRNVFVSGSSSSEPEVVAIDWSGIGLGPLETDIGTMVGSSLTWGDDEADIVLRGSEEIFGTYLAGLRVSGWRGSESDSRIGFWFAAGGYGSYLASFPAMVDAQFGAWEFIVQRFGEDSERLEARCFERLEIVVDFVEEAASLLP